MSKLVDMKLLKSQREGLGLTAPTRDVKEPPYPYGLRITLENEALKKLGKTAKDFEYGGRMKMPCEVEVVSLNESQDRDNKGEKRETVGLQIIKMGVE